MTNHHLRNQLTAIPFAHELFTFLVHDLLEKHIKPHDDIYKYEHIDFKFVVIYVINNSL